MVGGKAGSLTHLDVHDGLGAVRLDVAQVAGVPLALAVAGGAVLALVDVEVGPGRGAAVGAVAELVDVEPVQALRQVAHLALDVHLIAL